MVQETDRVRLASAWRTDFIKVVLPVPDGADKTNSFGVKNIGCDLKFKTGKSKNGPIRAVFLLNLC